MFAPGATSETTMDIVAPTAFVESILIRIGARRRPATRCSPSLACSTAPAHFDSAGWACVLARAVADWPASAAANCRNDRRLKNSSIASAPLAYLATRPSADAVGLTTGAEPRAEATR